MGDLSPEPVTIDFETRSAEEIKFGAYRYAEHSTTEIMCLAILFPEDQEASLWHPDVPSLGLPEVGVAALDRLQEHISRGGLVEAHNAQFERAIWENVAVDRLGWTPVEPSQWRCSAALARAMSLPPSLDGVSKALGLAEEKDAKGSRIMKKISKPRSCLKADMMVVAEALLLDPFTDPGVWKKIPKPKNIHLLKERYPDFPGVQALNTWHEDIEEFEKLYSYCKTDTVVERAVSRRLAGGMSDDELEIWQLDQEMNHHGVFINMNMVDAALKIAEDCAEASEQRLREITNGAVQSANKRAALMEWVNSQPGTGYIENTQKATIEEALKDKRIWSKEAYEVLQIRKDMAKTSTKKYESMRNCVGKDGRVRGLLQYQGAGPGRWAGRLVQPQNFPRGTIKAPIETLCSDVQNHDYLSLDLMYGEGAAMEVISSALRGAITEEPGYELICADYSSVEARGVFWAAGDTEAIEVFNAGRDIYLDMASDIYDIRYEDLDPGGPERMVGKQAILGLGYQMGSERFQEECGKVGLDFDLDFCEKVVMAYRSKHWLVKEFWYDMQRAMTDAIAGGKGGPTIECGKFKFEYTDSDFLQMILPSGRRVSYFQPRMEERFSEMFDRWAMKITYMGINSVTRKFERMETYGGKIVENAIQAMCRDLMAFAMKNVRGSKLYRMLLTVHDELIAAVKQGVGSVEEFENLICKKPGWAAGFPLLAEGWRGPMYKK